MHCATVSNTAARSRRNCDGRAGRLRQPQPAPRWDTCRRERGRSPCCARHRCRRMPRSPARQASRSRSTMRGDSCTGGGEPAGRCARDRRGQLQRWRLLRQGPVPGRGRGGPERSHWLVRWRCRHGRRHFGYDGPPAAERPARAPLFLPRVALGDARSAGEVHRGRRSAPCTHVLAEAAIHGTYAASAGALIDAAWRCPVTPCFHLRQLDFYSSSRRKPDPCHVRDGI